tara:strand:+ start:169 stop:489 length:321 start_codon:yes stop_codon:yes gene_type:complete
VYNNKNNMKDQKKGSIRFDSTDLVRLVGIWRSPEILNAVVGNFTGFIVFGFLIYFGVVITTNLQQFKTQARYTNQCMLQMMEAGQKVDRTYCRLASKVRVQKESSK